MFRITVITTLAGEINIVVPSSLANQLFERRDVSPRQNAKRDACQPESTTVAVHVIQILNTEVSLRSPPLGMW